MSLMIDSAPFIEAIQHLIKEKGLTQAELAEKSGLSRSQLSRLLSGKNKRVQQSTVDKVLAAFGLSKQEFSAMLSDKPIVSKSKNLPKKTIYSDRLPTVVGQFIGRTAELEILDDAWANPDISIIELIAPGGTGKTKLLREWLNGRRDKITSMIAWSFYSQGASTNKQISTSPFFDHALKILDDERKTFSSDEDKGDYIANLLREKQCLLVLDGLEPLQHADAANRGELKDRALAILLKNLAGQSGAFCVITSRIAIYELSDRISVKSHNLQNLESTDALALLKSLGVKNKEKDLLKTINDYAGHALALSLLGNLLRLRYGGDINKLGYLPSLLQEGGDKTSRHAFRVMQAYEEWFENTPELSLLLTLGLFDHPVEIEALEALWDAKIIGLTDDFEEVSWLNAIDSLRNDHHILTDLSHTEQSGETPQTLDCHPLIREYFGRQLEKIQPAAWQAAHKCLYKYYKKIPEKELPDTLEEMRPLFHAVKHGCEAGLSINAFTEVYLPRLFRGDEMYLTSKLEAFSDQLSVTAYFFSNPWDKTKENLPDDYKTTLIASAMYCLYALGRSKEAIQPSKDFFNALVKQKIWEKVTSCAELLSKQQLTLGYLPDAIETAQFGIKYSDSTKKVIEKVEIHTVCAKALHQAGKTKLALALYEKSEVIYISETLDSPFLYGDWGYYDLLIDLREFKTVLNNIQKQQESSQNKETNKPPPLEMIMCILTMARLELQANEYSDAAEKLEVVVNAFQNSGRRDLIALGLLTRAALSVETNNFTKARQDLQEVSDIAHSHGMRLHLTDYHLEMARLLLKQWQQQLLDDSAQFDIQNHVASAVKLIDETSYHRRDAEVEALIGPSQTTQDKQKKWSEEW